MKKQLLFVGSLTLLLLFTNCKKDSQSSQPAEQQIDPKGTWSLSSYNQSSGSSSSSYATTQFPCIANNKFIINADGTFSSEYAAQDTCYLYKAQNSSIILGAPGDKNVGTWTASNKTVSVKYSNASSAVQAQLSAASGKSYLTFNTTSGSNTYIMTYVK